MNLENLLDKFSSNPLFIAVSLLLFLIPLLKFLKESFIDLEISRFKKIINTKDYENSLSEEVKNSLVDARDRAVFERIYGLNINKKYRNIVFKIISQPNINIDCEDIRRSFFYIDFEDNYMTIEYRPWINILRRTNIFGGSFFIIVSFSCFSILVFFYKNLNTLDITYYVVIALLYILLAFDRFKQARLLRSVIRILAQADQLPQYIKVDEDWLFKKPLHRIGVRPKSFSEQDFEAWEK